MKTQGISLIMSGSSAKMSGKSTKVNDSAFDSFMDTHASKVSAAGASKEALSVSDKADVTNSKQLTAKNDMESKCPDAKAAGEMTKKPLAAQGDTGSETVEDVDMSEMMEQMMAMLQEFFGLSDEELTDVMEQLGMQMQDMLFLVQNNTIVLADTGAIQKFVLGVHGIEDTAAILTNDTLNQEIGQLTEELTNILAEGFGVKPEQVADLPKDLMLNFAEQMQQAAQSVTEPEELPQDAKGLESMPVIVEEELQQNEGGEDDSLGYTKEGMTNSSESALPLTELHEQAVTTFTDKLSQALEKVSNAEELSELRTMTQIVEQVVRQVKIRVMPMTTSMEMQLNPASLGRVNLTVATTGGIATATMVVENQMAKNALESQMITLKETFAEQGLKVEEVEVTVAEFGLKKENQEQQETGKDKKQNRRFRSDDEISEDGDAVTETNMTASDRRDANSMVDYTA